MAESKPSKEATSRNGNAESAETRKRLRVLDDRTSQRLAIAFNRLPPPDRLAAIVDTLVDFPESLPVEAVLALNAAISEQREAVEQLRQMNMQDGDITQLDLPERYLWTVSRVQFCTTKLACGALIVGPARELGDLRYAGMAVGTCCRALRESSLLQRCISTSLAVGNFMNRGTARSDAKAVVLPDSLLKLEELRGVNEGNQSPRNALSDVRAPSLLDFVAQALVDNVSCASGGGPHALRAETNELRGKVRAAQSVSLEEAEASCLKVCADAERAWNNLAELPKTQAVYLISDKIRWICEEAITARTLVMGAKAELSKTQKWSSAKGKIKSDEWLAGWSDFLQRLADAFGRAQPPAAAVAVSSAKKPFARDKDEQLDGLPLFRGASLGDGDGAAVVAAVETPKAVSVASSPMATQPGAPARSSSRQQPAFSPTYDEDARIEAGAIERLLGGGGGVSKTAPSPPNQGAPRGVGRDALAPLPQQPAPAADKPRTYTLFPSNAPPLCGELEGKENCN